MGDGRFFEQFIEDFFAECDEHLRVVRRVLLALEERAATARPDADLLRDLARSLHTIKGLSGMVGLGTAERVAHAMEDLLRDAGAEPERLDARVVESLFAGTHLLERCIAAHRTGAAPPDLSAFLGNVGALLAAARHAHAAPARPEHGSAAPGAASPGSDLDARIAAARRDGDRIYRFAFRPSLELAKRGVGVEAVRARLQTLGDVLDARPHLGGGSGIAFEFLVAVHGGAEPDDAWRADDLAWTLNEPAAAATAPPAPAVGVGVAAEPDALIARDGGGLVPGAATVRVELARLDELMRLVGELVISRARLADALREARTAGAGAVWDGLHETSAAMERQLRALREGVMRVRLVPLGEVFERMRYAVRDIGREVGKTIRIEMSGQDTEIDKLVVDRMLEPLLHLVRNAVSHGIEDRDERRARGKPADGRLALRAAASGDRIIVEVEDDGAGIDLERVAAQARRGGILGEHEPLAPEALLDILCAPGFSTRGEADLTSGRGVGMAVVRSTIRGLAGELRIDTAPGRGTRFIIELPLTLMIVDALLVDIGGQAMALPQPALREILQVSPDALTRFERNDVISYRGGVLPLLDLRRLFDLPEVSRAALYVLVVGSEAQPVGLVVDRLLGLREVVVSPVSDPLVAMPGIAGATELGDGRVSLILDAAALVRLARTRRERGAGMAGDPAARAHISA